MPPYEGAKVSGPCSPRHWFVIPHSWTTKDTSESSNSSCQSNPPLGSRRAQIGVGNAGSIFPFFTCPTFAPFDSTSCASQRQPESLFWPVGRRERSCRRRPLERLNRIAAACFGANPPGLVIPPAMPMRQRIWLVKMNFGLRPSFSALRCAATTLLNIFFPTIDNPAGSSF
jgi:hypothetical protein